MYSHFVSRVALLAAVSLTVGAGINARAEKSEVPAPTLTFALPGEVTIHKTEQCLQVAVQASDATGLRSLSISGGYSGGTSYFQAGTKSAATGVGFYACYFPVGDYVFRATAINAAGKMTTQKIMVHLIP